MIYQERSESKILDGAHLESQLSMFMPDLALEPIHLVHIIRLVVTPVKEYSSRVQPYEPCALYQPPMDD